MTILELTFLPNRTEIKSGAIYKQLPLEHQHVLNLLHKGSFCRQQPHKQAAVFCGEVYSAHLGIVAGNCDSDLLLSSEGIRKLCLQAGCKQCKQGWRRDRLCEGQVMNPVLLVLIEPRSSAGIRTRIHLWIQMETDGKQAVSHSKWRGGDSGQRKGFVK